LQEVKGFNLFSTGFCYEPGNSISGWAVATNKSLRLGRNLNLELLFAVGAIAVSGVMRSTGMTAIELPSVKR
jgi:hypothetical protein